MVVNNVAIGVVLALSFFCIREVRCASFFRSFFTDRNFVVHREGTQTQMEESKTTSTANRKGNNKRKRERTDSEDSTSSHTSTTSASGGRKVNEDARMVSAVSALVVVDRRVYVCLVFAWCSTRCVRVVCAGHESGVGGEVQSTRKVHRLKEVPLSLSLCVSLCLCLLLFCACLCRLSIRWRCSFVCRWLIFRAASLASDRSNTPDSARRWQWYARAPSFCFCFCFYRGFARTHTIANRTRGHTQVEVAFFRACAKDAGDGTAFEACEAGKQPTIWVCAKVRLLFSLIFGVGVFGCLLIGFYLVFVVWLLVVSGCCLQDVLLLLHKRSSTGKSRFAVCFRVSIRCFS